MFASKCITLTSGCHLVAVARLVRFSDPKTYAGWDFLSLVGSTLPDWLRVETQQRTAPGSPGWGLGDGPITHPHKTALDY